MRVFPSKSEIFRCSETDQEATSGNFEAVASSLVSPASEAGGWRGRRSPAPTRAPIFKVIAYSCRLDDPQPPPPSLKRCGDIMTQNALWLNRCGIFPSVAGYGEQGEAGEAARVCQTWHDSLSALPPPQPPAPYPNPRLTPPSHSSGLLLFHPARSLPDAYRRGRSIKRNVCGRGKSLATCGESLRRCHTLSCP